MYCPKCGASLPPEAKFCSHCGLYLASEKKKCSNCGNVYNLEMVYCENCGTILEKIFVSQNASPYLMCLNMVSFYNGDTMRKIPDSVGSLSFCNERMEFTPVTENNRFLSWMGSPQQPNGVLCSFNYRDIEFVDESTKLGMPCIMLRFKDGRVCAFSKVGSQIHDAARFIEMHLQ